MTLSFLFILSLQLTDCTCRHAHDESIFRDVLGHDRTCAGARPIAELDRSDKHRIRTDKYILTDFRWILFLTIVVGGDRPGADIRIRTDGRVANIREVSHLDAFAQRGILHFTEVPHMDMALQMRPFSKPRKRTHVHIIFEDGEKEFEVITVVTDNGGSPCGGCRQVMAEFGLDTIVLMADGSGRIVKEATVKELLPEAFTPDHLEKR